MSSRYPPYLGDPRYGSRERSPSRSNDRRGSIAYDSVSTSRNSDSIRRDDGSEMRDSQAREPPRGPKALVEPSRQSSLPAPNTAVPAGPRGRGGFSGRGDFRDRDFRDGRDLRDGPSLRDDRDRDMAWRERETDRDRRRSPPIRPRSPPIPGRARSPHSRARTPPIRPRSPPAREFARDLDADRARRNSRDGPLSAGSSSSDPSAAAIGAYAGRGGFGRGRGRGDFEFRGRGRGYVDERERYAAGRSRSRDRRWDRERDGARDRDWERDRERDFDARRSEREDREREAEKYKRDRLAGASEPRAVSGAATTPTTPRPLSTASHPNSGDNRFQSDANKDALSVRRLSTISTPSTTRDAREERPDGSGGRSDATKGKLGSRGSSPPQAPQVPAFGSYANQTFATTTTPTSNVWRATSPTKSAPQAAPSTPQAPRAAPIGPKGLVAPTPPTGPRADRMPDRPGPSNVRDVKDGESFANTRPQPSIMGSLGRPPMNASNVATPSQSVETSPAARSRPPPTGPQASLPRPGSSSSSQGFSRHEDRSGPVPNINQGLTPAPPPRSSFNRSPPAGPSIPTGPRADRGGRGRGNQWVRSGYPYAGVGRGGQPLTLLKRDNVAEESSRPIVPGRGINRPVNSSNRLSGPSDSLRKDSPPRLNTHFDSRQKSDGRDVEMTEGRGERSQNPFSLLSADTHGPAFALDADDDEDDDDPSDLIAIFEENDDKHTRQIAALQAKVDAGIRALEEQSEQIEYMKIILAEHADELVGDDQIQAQVEEPADGSIVFAPTTAFAEEENDILMSDVSQALQEIAPKRPETPPLESLPFLLKEKPKPIQESTIFQENAKLFQTLQIHLQAKITEQRMQAARDERALKKWYKVTYEGWREYCEILEREFKDNHAEDVTADRGMGPPSPVPTAPIEGRRGAKLNSEYGSEYDIEKLLRETELEARENQRLAALQAEEKFDEEREAAIPPMIEPTERSICLFQDYNNFVDLDNILNRFEYISNDVPFSAEESETFTQAYVDDPKKFGRIAAKLPGRTYQECIHHYYLTKGHERYKQKLHKAAQRRTRKARVVNQPRSRTANFITDNRGLDDGDEDAPMLPVTDTGRPRRAAAPTFGEVVAEADPTAATGQGRKTPGSTKPETNMNVPTDRSNKRTKGGAPREKGLKRGRNQLLAAAPTPSPQKQERVKERTPAPSVLPSAETLVPMQIDQPVSQEVMGAQLLAGLQASTHETPSPASAPIMPQIEEKAVPIPVVVTQSRAQPEAQKQHRAQQQKEGASSSYWSVPEVQDFPRLLKYYGQNWEEFAEHMTSKSATMIKNYYSREISRGKTEYEMYANAAMEKRKRGEDLGPPPTVSALTRKRVETPQPTSHRPLAPSVEALEGIGISPKPQASLPVQASPPQHPPRYSTLARAASPQSQMQNLHTSSRISPQGSMSGEPQHHRQQAQQQIQAQAPIHRGQDQVPGPRAGYFTEGSRVAIQPQPDPASVSQHRSQISQSQQQARSPQQRNIAHQRVSSTSSNLTASYKPLTTTSQKPAYGNDEAVYRERSAPSAPLHPRNDHSDSMQIDSRQASISQRASHQQQYQPQQASHRPVLETKDSAPYGRPPSQPQTSARPLAVDTLVRETRPSSIQSSPVGPPSQPSRPPEVKKSSIMSLLNNDPEEPIPRRSLGDRTSSIPTPPPRSPQPPMYPSQNSVPPQQRSSQEVQMDQRYSSHTQQQASYRSSYGSSSQQPVRTLPEIIAGSPVSSSSHHGPYSRSQYVPQSHSPPAQTPYPQPHSYRSSNNGTPPALIQQAYAGQRRSSLSDRSTPLPPRQANPQSSHPPSSQAPSMHEQRYFQHGQHQQPNPTMRQMAPQPAPQMIQDPRSGYSQPPQALPPQQQQQQGGPPTPYPPHQQPPGQPPRSYTPGSMYRHPYQSGSYEQQQRGYEQHERR